jgi:hypothetical protein
MRTLVTNVQALEAFEVVDNSPQSLIKNVLIESAARIRVAVGEFLMTRAASADDDQPTKLNHYLRKHKVPNYLFGKMTGALITFRQVGFELSSILFPSDPSKGFYLTWREINSDLIKSLGGLLSGADLVLKIAQDHKLVRKLINVSEAVNLTDFETTNSFASKIAGTPFLIPPFDGAVQPATVFKFLAKNGSRGIQFNSGNVLSPQDNLKFVGTLGKRAAYMLLQRPAYKAEIFASFFPGFEYDILVNDKKDIYVQLQEWSKLQSATDMNDAFKSLTVASEFDRNDKVKYLILDLLGLARGSALGKEILELMNVKTPNVPLPHGSVTVEVDLFTSIKNRAVNLRETKSDLSDIIKDKFKGIEGLKPRSEREREERSAKRFGRSGLTERSTLGNQAEVVIHAVKKAGYKTLASRLGPWFRQFLTPEIQGAAASIFMARLDAFLAEPLTVTREERIAFMDADTFGNESEPSDTSRPASPLNEDQEDKENPDLE